MIRAVFHIPLCALHGVLMSLVLLMNLSLTIPCYTQICRRAKKLGQEMIRLSIVNVTDLVIDSTCLKVYGEGEWKVRKHGYSKRRTWRKLHLAVCPDFHEIVFEVLTENDIAGCSAYPEFLNKAPYTVERAYGDGASNTAGCYRVNERHGSSPIIPPKSNAVFR